jgi:ParB-like chromosome segregation protein Spo0J
MAMVSSARTASSSQELLAMQSDADAIIREALECYDEGAIEEEELAAFGLVLELLSHAIAERRAALRATRPLDLATARATEGRAVSGS